MKNNTSKAQLTLPTNLQPLGVQHEMDFQKGSNVKAPGGKWPFGAFLVIIFAKPKIFKFGMKEVHHVLSNELG